MTEHVDNVRVCWVASMNFWGRLPGDRTSAGLRGRKKVCVERNSVTVRAVRPGDRDWR